MSNMDDVGSQNDPNDQSDEEETATPVLNERAKKSSGKTFRRPFVFLPNRLDSVPQKSRLESLKKEGRMQEIAFQRRHTAREIGRYLLASFPMLLVKDLASLTFIKSYNKGHAMADIHHGLMSGDELVGEFSTAHAATKIFFVLDPLPPTSTNTVQTSKVDLTITPPPKDGKSTRRLLTAIAKGTSDNTCIPSLVNPPWSSTKMTSVEVVSLAMLISKMAASNTVPPFLTHSFDELMYQLKQDSAVCVLTVLSPHSQSSDVGKLLKILTNISNQFKKCYFWLADSQSKEGKKVTTKYGLGNASSLLILAPGSHVPHCVEIFSETSMVEGRVKEAIEAALQVCSGLRNERSNFNIRPEEASSKQKHDNEESSEDESNEEMRQTLNRRKKKEEKEEQKEKE